MCLEVVKKYMNLIFSLLLLFVQTCCRNVSPQSQTTIMTDTWSQFLLYPNGISPSAWYSLNPGSQKTDLYVKIRSVSDAHIVVQVFKSVSVSLTNFLRIF